MKTHDKKIPLIMGLALLFALAASLYGLTPGLAQENMTHIKADAFTAHTRGPARFKHDQHNEKAKIEECERCHHGKDQHGKQDPADMTAGTPCADCHAVNTSKGTSLRQAYHAQCIGCHRESNAGPTHCAGCHEKQS